MKKALLVVIIALVFFVAYAVFWTQGVHEPEGNGTANGNSSSVPQNGNNEINGLDGTENSTTIIEILSFTTNKQVYHSKDLMQTICVVNSSEKFENVTFWYTGLVNTLGSDYLSQKRLYNLLEGTNEINFDYITPSCYGCVALQIGPNYVTVKIIYQEDLIANETADITVEP